MECAIPHRDHLHLAVLVLVLVTAAVLQVRHLDVGLELGGLEQVRHHDGQVRDEVLAEALHSRVHACCM